MPSGAVSTASWFRRHQDRLLISVHVMPGAKRTGIQGLHGDALKIRVAAPPVDGAANDELHQFLAEVFSVPRRNVELISGASSRSKRFSILGSVVDPPSLLNEIAKN